jgi:hypothetical protein
MILLQHNESVAGRRDIFLQMVDAADHITPKTGLTLSLQMVKAGTTQYQPCAGTVSEIGAGTYRLRLDTADLNTLGAAMLEVTAPGADNRYIPIQVVRFLDEVHLAKAALTNSRSHVVETGVDQIKDDDGITVLRTLTPSEVDGTITVSAS